MSKNKKKAAESTATKIQTSIALNGKIIGYQSLDV